MAARSGGVRERLMVSGETRPWQTREKKRRMDSRGSGGVLAVCDVKMGRVLELARPSLLNSWCVCSDALCVCVCAVFVPQRKRAERQFKRECAIASREEAKKYHDLVIKRKKEAKKLRDEQAKQEAGLLLWRSASARNECPKAAAPVKAVAMKAAEIAKTAAPVKKVVAQDVPWYPCPAWAINSANRVHDDLRVKAAAPVKAKAAAPA